jgi:hypothetical protein
MWLKRSKLIVRQLAFVFVLIIPQMVFGWGREGHMIVAQVGSELARTNVPFWKANEHNMVLITVVPDLVWKDLPTNNIEKPTHFFQPDSYFQDPSQFNQIPRAYSDAVTRFSEPFVDKNGTSVWRAPQFYALAVQALRAGDFKSAVELAGVMSHYIGDMSQPLHDTSNYDGQMTGQPGIHAFFETTNIVAADHNILVAQVTQQAQALLANPNFIAQFRGSLVDSSFVEVGRAFMFKDKLLQIDKAEGRTGQGAQDLLNLAVARMADGAASLAVVLTRMWQDAGNPTSGSSVMVQVPKWVAPNYTSSSSQMSLQQRRPGGYVQYLEEDDDCNQ